MVGVILLQVALCDGGGLFSRAVVHIVNACMNSRPVGCRPVTLLAYSLSFRTNWDTHTHTHTHTPCSYLHIATYEYKCLRYSNMYMHHLQPTQQAGAVGNTQTLPSGRNNVQSSVNFRTFLKIDRALFQVVSTRDRSYVLGCAIALFTAKH